MFTIPVTVAYIDPSAVSILVVSISGIVAAIGATVFVLWRKAKQKVADVLNIDENANKEVEEELVINSGADTDNQ